MDVNLFHKEHFKPYQLLVIYKSDEDNYYVETSKVNNGIAGAVKALSKPELSDFAKTILSADQGFTFSSGGQIAKNIVSFSMREGKFNAVWKVKPGKRKLLFTKNSGIKSGIVKCPQFLFKVEFDELYVYVLRKSGKKIEVCHTPLPNIYETGNVCLGNSIINDSSRSISDFTKYWESVFFRSYFSDHGVDSGHVKINIPNLWNELIGTDKEFPYEKLVPIKTSLKQITSI